MGEKSKWSYKMDERVTAYKLRQGQNSPTTGPFGLDSQANCF